MVATFWLMAGGATLSVRADDRFTVLGWVKHKLSPEEEARSAARSARLKPMPGAAEPSYQNVAMMSPATSPPVSPAMEAPGVDQFAVNQAPLSPDPMVPSRPISRETAAAESMPPPRQMPPSPEPPREPAPQVGRDAGPGPARQEFSGERSLDELRRRAEYLSTRGLGYKFGGDHPSEGGMDCSGTMQFLLKSMGYSDIPRTSYDQFEWLGKQGTLKKVGFWHSHERAINNLRPGDLIFWGGTYDSGHKVSHVMVYLGKSRTGTHFIFGARGKKVKGLNGAGVDIFEYNPGRDKDRLVGYGRLPGLKS